MAVESSLPAYTTMENIIKLIDALRRKNNNEEEAKPLFGMGDSAFRNTKSALRYFGIIKESSMDFTDVGRQIAYAENDEERKRIIFSIILNYPPYESLLHNIVAKEEAETELNSIIGFWGKFGYGSTERNRKDGASLFGNIIEYIGFGRFTKGRGKSPTRIVWNPDFKSKLQDNATHTPDKPEKKLDENFVPQSEIKVFENNSVNEIPKNGKETIYFNPINYSNTNLGPSIIIKVDMTSWPEEKIKNFFKFAYGHFGIEDE